MANVTYDPPETAVEPQKKSSGCLWGCLAVTFLVVAGVLCTGLLGYWWLSSTVAKYTSDTPVELPTVEYSPEKLAELESRIDKFSSAVEEGTPTNEDLVLTAEEINALISKDEQMRGKVFVRIENGQVGGDLSIPTDMIPGGDGRFFNGSASFNVSMENGVLIVTLADAEVNGERVPQHVIDSMAGENLAKDLYKDANNAKILRRFEDVSIEGDKIILRVRQKAENDDSVAQPPAEPDPPRAADEPSSESDEVSPVELEPDAGEPDAEESAIETDPAR